MQQSPSPSQAAEQLAKQLSEVQTALAGAQTRVDLDALVRKRSELKSQLQAISERRDGIAEQARHAMDAESQREAMARVKALDTRSARLEQQILQADDDIANAIAKGVSADAPPGFAVPPPPSPEQWMVGVPPTPPQVSRDVTGRALLLEGVGFVLLGVVLWRYAWKRAERKFARAAPPAIDQSSRFDQLQQAVDVIALEVERISEGQRYVAKQMNERVQPAIGAGEAQPISAKRKATVPAQASDEIE